MTRLATGLIGLVLGVSVASAQESPSSLESDPSGWTDLLADAGADLAGWTRLPIPASGKLSERSPWALDAGTAVLDCRGDEAGHEWLRWDKEQGDGILHVEWRFEPVGEKQGFNSGVFVWSSRDGRVWHQAQSGADATYLFGQTSQGGEVGKMIRIEPISKPLVRPPGEWNVVELRCHAPVIEMWANGAVVGRWEGLEVERGHLGLEAEGWRVAFRKVMFKPTGGAGG